MLHLLSNSDPAWLPRAIEHMDEILLDHAHLEKKAASAALTMIFRYPEHPQILTPLSALAREELEHFELVLDALEARGQVFERQKPSPYAGRLRSIERKSEPDRMLDAMLCCAVIEARSCERMKLLAEGLEDEPRLQKLYRGLLVAEARHHRLYLDLAETVFEPPIVAARLLEVVEHEADVLRRAPPIPRLHN